MKTNRHVLCISNAILGLYNDDMLDTDTKLVLASVAIDVSSVCGDALLDNITKSDFKERVLDIIQAANVELVGHE